MNSNVINNFFKLDKSIEYDIVFSGGGLRSIYGLGFLDALKNNGLRIGTIYASSSAAIFSIPILTNTTNEFLNICLSESKLHKINLVESLINKKNIFPFQRTFSQILDKSIQLEDIQKSKINLIFSAFENSNTGYLKKLLQFYKLALKAEKDIQNKNNESIEYAKEINLNEYIFNIKDVLDREYLIEAILATCSIPPLIRSESHLKNYIDGGLIWPLPIHLPFETKSIELKTSILKTAKKMNPLILICNSEKIYKYSKYHLDQIVGRMDESEKPKQYWHISNSVNSIKMWDYSKPSKFQTCFNDGYVNGEKVVLI
jgi:predicted patatin/cPLA2 family phospholipase